MGKRFKGTAPAIAVLLGVLLFASLSGCNGFISMDEVIRLLESDITAVEPNIVVQLADETRIDHGTGEYNFGSIINDNTIGGFASSPIEFRIYNKGGYKSSLSVTSVSLSAGDTADFVLPAVGGTALDFDESLSFTIQFDPTKAANLSATVTIQTNDPDTAAYTFTAKGTGVQAILNTVPVPAVTSFSIGYAGVADTVHTVASITAFEMGRHEVTYEEWSNVKTWAEAGTHGYTFANSGLKGNSGSGTNTDPVTTISWRDAIVWCNAASELSGLTPCYYTDSSLTTVYKNATTVLSLTNNCVDTSTKGYRLPTEAEWEYAARYISGGVSAAGNLASGAGSGQENLYSWNLNNGLNTTHPVEGKLPNALGIYDMSGNAAEWCWDRAAIPYPAGPVAADYMGPDAGANRIYRGGAYRDIWVAIVSEVYTSYRTNFSAAPSEFYNCIGFRVVRRP